MGNSFSLFCDDGELPGDPEVFKYALKCIRKVVPTKDLKGIPTLDAKKAWIREEEENTIYVLIPIYYWETTKLYAVILKQREDEDSVQYAVFENAVPKGATFDWKRHFDAYSVEDTQKSCEGNKVLSVSLDFKN